VGLDPQSGKTLLGLSVPSQANGNRNRHSLIHGDMLFVTAFYDGSLVLRLRQDKLAVEKGMAAMRTERAQHRLAALQ